MESDVLAKTRRTRRHFETARSPGALAGFRAIIFAPIIDQPVSIRRKTDALPKMQRNDGHRRFRIFRMTRARFISTFGVFSPV
jgi:hypothetical protein